MKEGGGRINIHTHSMKLIYKKNRTLSAIFLYISKKSSTFVAAMVNCPMTLIGIIYATSHFNERDVAQPGSATVWGTGGRKFKSCHPDKLKCMIEEE